MTDVTAGQRRDLIRRLVPLVEAGWDHEGLLEELARNLDTANDLVGVWIHRLSRLPLQPLPRPQPVPRADVAPAASTWCGQCAGERHRWVERDPQGNALDTPLMCPCHPGHAYATARLQRQRWTPVSAEADRAHALQALEAAYPGSVAGS
jgi:hypothetical protein